MFLLLHYACQHLYCAIFDHQLAHTLTIHAGGLVIQAVAVAELDGLNTPNPYGDCPFHKNNPRTPNEEYFQHVDYGVDAAEQQELFIGFLPTWGSHVVSGVINEGNARAYGHYLGNRYKDRTIALLSL